MEDTGTSAQRGRALRAEVRRSEHGRWQPASDRPDPAAIMAADLATTARSGLEAQLCGDAHVANFGSVGMEAWIVLLLGNGPDDPLFLQIKEAERLGRRVVEGQRLIQAGGDAFLGWLRLHKGRDGRRHHYYVRQLWDARSRFRSRSSPRTTSRSTPACVDGRSHALTPAPVTVLQ